MVRRVLMVSGALVLAALGAWWWFGRGADEGRKAPPPAAVIAWQVKPMQRGETLQALGTMQAHEATVLTAKTQNRVRRIAFEDNQRVAKGDVLVEFENAEQRARLTQAQAQLERARVLVAENVASQAMLEDRQRAYDEARAQLNDQRVVAPFDGVLGLRQLSVGALVQPGTVITTLDDDRVMKVDFTVPETALGSIAVGSVFMVRMDALQGREFEGRITGVGTRIDSVSRAVAVRGEIANPEGVLKPGMLARVRVAYDVATRLMVPEEALLMEGQQAYVLALQPEGEGLKVVRQNVRTGLRVQGFVELMEGVNNGTQIVSHGVQKARPGAVVRVLGVQDETTDIEALLRSASAGLGSGGAR